MTRITKGIVRVNDMLGELFLRLVKMHIPDILGIYTGLDSDSILLDDSQKDKDMFELRFSYSAYNSFIYMEYSYLSNDINKRNYPQTEVINIMNLILNLLELNFNVEDYPDIVVVQYISNAPNQIYNRDYVKLGNKIKEYLNMSDNELELLMKLI